MLAKGFGKGIGEYLQSMKPPVLEVEDVANCVAVSVVGNHRVDWWTISGLNEGKVADARAGLWYRMEDPCTSGGHHEWRLRCR
jgi:hypothetical protein